eukprot:1786056-Prymnesium_polylepis.1
MISCGPRLPALNMAWPHHHGSAMYDEPSAYVPCQPFCLSFRAAARAAHSGEASEARGAARLAAEARAQSAERRAPSAERPRDPPPAGRRRGRRTRTRDNLTHSLLGVAHGVALCRAAALKRRRSRASLARARRLTRRRVDVRHEGAEDGDGGDDGPVVAGPVVEAERHDVRAQHQEPRLEDDLTL